MSKFFKRREKRMKNPEFREAHLSANEELKQTVAIEPAREKKTPRFDENEFSGPFEEESPAPAPRRQSRPVEPDEWGPAV